MKKQKVTEGVSQEEKESSANCILSLRGVDCGIPLDVVKGGSDKILEKRGIERSATVKIKVNSQGDVSFSDLGLLLKGQQIRSQTRGLLFESQNEDPTRVGSNNKLVQKS